MKTASSTFGSLAGQTALVSGASSGIGRAIAVELAAAGAFVLVHFAHSQTEADITVSRIHGAGGLAETVQADFSTSDGAQCLCMRIKKNINPVDILVCNAGADILTGRLAEESFEAKRQSLWDVDVRATMDLARTLGREMKARRKGSIVTIGWDQADRGMEGDSGELFATTKNAVMGFSRSLALSLAPEVRVNCVCPGWILTAWGETAGEVWQERVLRETPLKRWGHPEDIARMVRFLSSDDASFITGQVINVNGGAIR